MLDFSSKFVRSSQTVLCAFFLGGSLLAPAKPVITDITVTNSEVTLLFENTDGSTQFTMQKNLGLDAANWANAPNATLTALGGNKYSFAVPRTSADKQFYRILASLVTGTALDPDGDGLASTLETSFTTDRTSPLYSDPNLFDTDGDGFSDGVEFAMGTLPNNPISKPDFASLPVVNFFEPFSEATEGVSPHQVKVVGSGGYSGTIHYSINARSTAASPAEFTLGGGTVTMSGGVAMISVNLVDDLNFSPARLIMIDLSVDPPGNGYRASGAVTHVANLSDNDNYWTGALVDGDITRDFRLRICSGSTKMGVAFVAGMSDGLPTPDGGLSSQSTGVIPVTDLAGDPLEVFIATGASSTATSFTATSPEMPVTTTGAFAGVGLKRVLALNANSVASAAAGHSVTPAVIVGTFTETISHATDPTVTYLDSVTTGNFVLARDQPAPPVLPSVFTP